MVVLEPNDRIHFLDWGGPQPSPGRPGVLLVHGLSGTAWAWAPVARRLRALRRTVALDLRGHGLSDSPTHGYEPRQLAEDAIAVAEGAGLVRLPWDADPPPSAGQAAGATEGPGATERPGATEGPGAGGVVLAGHGFGAIVWSPLEGGWLGGRYRKGKPVPEDSRARNQTEFGAFVAPRFDMSTPAGARRLDVVEELARLADEAGVPLARYALAWVLRNPAVTSAIVGVREMRHLAEALRAVDIRIPEPHLGRIDALVEPGTNA